MIIEQELLYMFFPELYKLQCILKIVCFNKCYCANYTSIVKKTRVVQGRQTNSRSYSK